MSRSCTHSFLIHRYKRIVLFIDVKVLDDTLSQEILKVFQPKRQVMNMSLGQHWATALANDKWAHETTTICSNEHAIYLSIVVDGDKLLDSTSFSQ